MPELRSSSEPVVVRFSDADSGGPIAEHVVEWFDGENSIAVTRTDATGTRGARRVRGGGNGARHDAGGAHLATPR